MFNWIGFDIDQTILLFQPTEWEKEKELESEKEREKENDQVQKPIQMQYFCSHSRLRIHMIKLTKTVKCSRLLSCWIENAPVCCHVMFQLWEFHSLYFWSTTKRKKQKTKLKNEFQQWKDGKTSRCHSNKRKQYCIKHIIYIT